MMNTEISYGTSIYDYLETLSAQRDASRREKIFAVSSFEEAQAHSAEVKAKLKALLGKDVFAKGTHAPRILSTIRKNGLLIDKTVIEVRPGIYTAGLFMRREGATGKLPGVLGVCGHSNDGKACEPYQTFAMSLAMKGFGVFIFDPTGQGECHQFKPALTPTAEHSILGKALRCAGLSTTALFIHDARCALDYLLSRPEIDSERIGVTGSSGGGQMSFFLFGLDDRIKAAAASCHMNKFHDVFRNETPTDAESTPEGFIAAGCDRPDFAIAGAPKPFLLMATEMDFIDFRSVQKSYAEVSHIYKHLNAEEKLRLSVAPGPHSYCKISREAMYGFFTSLFLGKEDKEEPQLELLTVEESTVTPTGYTIDLPGAITESEAVMNCLPGTFPSPSEKIGEFLRSKLSLPAVLPPAPDYRVPRAVYLGEGCATGRFVLLTEPGTTIRPVLHKATAVDLPLIPKGKKGTLHCSHLSGRAEILSRKDEENLFILDVRGVGESRSTAGRGAKDDFFAPVGRDSFVEGTSEMHGIPLLGGKIKDLLNAIALLKAHGYEELTLSGLGMGGVIAAFAAAAVKLPVKEIILDQVPCSLKQLLAKHLFRLPNSVLPNGMLQHFDFPELYEYLKQNYTVTINCSEDVPEDL